MKKLEITSSLSEARRFEEAVYDMLSHKFEFEASDTVISKDSFNTDWSLEDRDAMDNLEEEAREALESAGLTEFDIQAVDVDDVEEY